MIHPSRYLLACLLVAAALLPGLPARASSAAPAMTGLHVRGNRIVNGSGQVVQLRGVNRSGAEYTCIQGNGLFEGPVDTASINAIAAWHVNTVRVPLNEDCWLGINGADPAYSGTHYKKAIIAFVGRLNRQGMAVILDLHWNGPGTKKATGQEPMPDADHAPAFWKDVASTFKSNLSVIFDLYNEPYPDSQRNTSAAWTCWLRGGACRGVSFKAAGMQSLIDVVRKAGAKNIIMLGGVTYANALSGWLSHTPSDPLGNLAASWHSYNFNECITTSCWNRTVGRVLKRVPVIAGEIGENNCGHGYIDRVMPWLDAHGGSYLAWTWDTWDCKSGPALISDYNGTPTAYGIGYKQHLAALARR